MLALTSVRLPRRDDANGGAVPVAMTDDKRSERTAEAEKNKTLLRSRMIGVRNQQGMLVKEDRLSVLERNPVFPLVCGILAIVPFEPQFGHWPV